MDAVALLHRAQEAGLHIEPMGDTLLVRGPKRAEAVVKLLAEHKAEVLAALSPPIGSWWREHFAGKAVEWFVGDRDRKLENSITENETPLTTEADDALIFPNFLLPSFDIQESSNPKYWFLCCRTCKLTWNLPKNPTRRTKDAVTILAAHADTHRESGSQCVTEPPPESACRVCGGTNGRFERVTYVGAPDGGVPLHFDCVAAFFEQLDGRAPIRFGKRWRGAACEALVAFGLEPPGLGGDQL